MAEQKCDICKNCIYAVPAQYRQVICKKTNAFKVELDSCERFKEKPKAQK